MCCYSVRGVKSGPPLQVFDIHQMSIDFDSNGISNKSQLFRRTHYDVKQGRIFCYFLCSDSGEISFVDINWSHSIHSTFTETPITRSSNKSVPKEPDRFSFSYIHQHIPHNISEMTSVMKIIHHHLHLQLYN